MKRKNPKSKALKRAKSSVSKLLGKKTHQNDITELMLRDHKPLKELIKTMKDSEAELAEVQNSFDEFAPLLEAHAKPEEQSLYVHLKQDEEHEIRQEGFEGQTEHAIADGLVMQIKSTNDEDHWRAQVKVLAELVEHHIEEEEDEMIPDIRKELGLDKRIEIGQRYLELREEYDVEKKAA
jgi:hypothetical protein